jgi:hypothetical protein
MKPAPAASAASAALAVLAMFALQVPAFLTRRAATLDEA